MDAVTFRCSPMLPSLWEKKFGHRAAKLRKVAEDEIATTARHINCCAKQIGTEADYDEKWSGGR